jgi:hypothetical protein
LRPRVQKVEEKVLKIDRPLAGGFSGLTALQAEGCGIAAFGGDEYIVSVTGFTFVSPLAHADEPEPPSSGRGWPLKGKRLTMICASLSLLQIMFAVHAVGDGG